MLLRGARLGIRTTHTSIIRGRYYGTIRFNGKHKGSTRLAPYLEPRAPDRVRMIAPKRYSHVVVMDESFYFVPASTK